MWQSRLNLASSTTVAAFWQLSNMKSRLGQLYFPIRHCGRHLPNTLCDESKIHLKPAPVWRTLNHQQSTSTKILLPKCGNDSNVRRLMVCPSGLVTAFTSPVSTLRLIPLDNAFVCFFRGISTRLCPHGHCTGGDSVLAFSLEIPGQPFAQPDENNDVSYGQTSRVYSHLRRRRIPKRT